MDEYSKQMWQDFAAAALPCVLNKVFEAIDEDTSEEDSTELFEGALDSACVIADKMVERYKARRKAYLEAQDPMASRRGK